MNKDLKKRAEDVVAQSKKHIFSVSAVYGVYNEMFKKKERPQTCSSCLQRIVSEIKEELKREETEIILPVANWPPEKLVVPQLTEQEKDKKEIMANAVKRGRPKKQDDGTKE